MRLLSWLIVLPIVFIVLSFALENRSDVTLRFWPLDGEVTLPLCILAVGLLAVGVGLGSFVTWVGMLKYRFYARSVRREVEALNKEEAGDRL